MARHSQRRGPTADFEVPAAFTTIPQMTVRRDFDAGALYISYYYDFDHTVAGTISLSSRVLINGVVRPALSVTRGTSGIIRTTHSAMALVTITQGLQLIELQASATAAAGDILRANTATLSVLQLPVWDDFSDIQQSP